MNDDERIADILGEWQARRDGGDDLDPEMVIAEHPDLADRLWTRFDALAALDQALADARRPRHLRPGAQLKGEGDW